MKTDPTLVTHGNGQNESDKCRGQRHRIGRFLSKPWSEKVKSIKYRWLRWFPSVPLPVKLPFGAWWLAEHDFCGVAVVLGGFENTERAFVESFLRSGMVVIDIGAHHGFYTLLASKKVGPFGRVLAFEPSPRERKRLYRHVKLNLCKNVKVWDCALGRARGTAGLFVVDGSETGCNSLRRPNASGATKTLSVSVSSLDECLEQEGIEHVDFVKLDVEGGEIEVLSGATRLLDRRPRPVFLCEVQEVRTAPWGYPAKDIVDYLRQGGFQWFSLSDVRGLSPIGCDQAEFDGNYVAIPEEKIAAVLGQGQKASAC